MDFEILLNTNSTATTIVSLTTVREIQHFIRSSPKIVDDNDIFIKVL